MARMIKDTPILTDEEWERLEEEMRNVKPASQEERDRIKEAYEAMRSIATFYMPEWSE